MMYKMGTGRPALCNVITVVAVWALMLAATFNLETPVCK